MGYWLVSSDSTGCRHDGGFDSIDLNSATRTTLSLERTRENSLFIQREQGEGGTQFPPFLSLTLA